MPKEIWKVEVTGDDIMKGTRRSSCYCPIALAFTRMFKERGITRPNLAVGRVKLTYDTLSTEFETSELPEEATLFIREYDDFKGVRPFSFNIEIDMPETAPAP